MIEPWGFENDEYRIGAVLAQLHNVNQTKKSKLKEAKDFMRNMAKAVLENLKPKLDINKLTREQLIDIIKKDFGIK